MTQPPLRVMQVVSNLDVGGAQEVVRTLAENLAGAGCVAIVCTFRDGPLRGEIERLGIPVEILPDRRSTVLALPFFLRDMFRIRRALARLVEAYGIDVVQTHLLRSLDFLVLTLRYGSTPLVFWTFQNARFDLREDHLARNRWLLRPKRLGHHLLYRLGARWVTGLIAVSEDVKKAILDTIGGIPADKIAVICNSVDTRRYRNQVDRSAVRHKLGLADADHAMAVVATFKRQKGHRYLIEAASMVVPRFPGLRLLFVGDGELREDLRSLTRSLNLDGHIRFLGTRNDVPELLAASDSFVLPSLWEGLPMALVEAMASGLPVIATEVSGTNQVVVSGETGLLVPPGDARRLAEAIIHLLSDPPGAAAMGIAARERVESHFSAQQQAREHIALFERELHRSGHHPARFFLTSVGSPEEDLPRH